MEEQVISFDTAKLAKEKGFDVEVFDSYHKNVRNNRIELLEFNSLCHGDSDDLINSITGDSEYCFPPKISFNTSWYKDYDYYSAPTQSLLQKWLREIHGYNIIVAHSKSHMVGTHKEKNRKQIFDKWKMSFKGRCYGEDFNSYEEALEIGLQTVLKLI